MVRFMFVTFAFLAWGFYVLSGGASFDPDRARLDSSSSDPLKQAEAQEPPAAEPRATDIEVTRVSLNLTSVENGLNGDEDTQTASRQSQQPELAVQTEADVDNIVILPSLVENAAPQTASLDADATDASLTAEQVSLDTDADIRVVSGNRVNVRRGPGTSHGVIGTVILGDRVEVLEESGTGWVRMRATDGDTVGWMAESLLSIY